MNDKLTAALDKVTKLRALASRATTRAEAEAAYAQAEAIIAKYQISEAQIESADAPQTEPIQEDGSPLYASKRRQSWIGILCAGLSKIHGCAVISGGAWRKEIGAQGVIYTIAGRASDVAIVRYLFAWLHVEIARLSDSEEGRAAKNAFRIGAVSGALRAMRTAQGAERDTVASGASVAMVLADRSAEAMKFFETTHGGIRKGARVTSNDRSGAYSRGQEAGQRLAPRPGLSASGHKLLGT